MAGREGPRGTVGTPGRPVLSHRPPRALPASPVPRCGGTVRRRPPGQRAPWLPEQPEGGYDPLALVPSFLKMTAHAADLRLRLDLGSLISRPVPRSLFFVVMDFVFLFSTFLVERRPCAGRLWDAVAGRDAVVFLPSLQSVGR